MREKYEWVFLNGRQKRIKRVQPLIEGVPADEFIRRNADPVWLMQNEMYEELHESEQRQKRLDQETSAAGRREDDSDDSIPF